MANDTISPPELHTLLNSDKTLDGFTITVKRAGKNRRSLYLTHEEALEIARKIQRRSADADALAETEELPECPAEDCCQCEPCERVSPLKS